MKNGMTKKIDEFIVWYETKAIHASTSEIGQFFPVIQMRELIDKVVSFYEEKYTNEYLKDEYEFNLDPEYSIDKLMESLNWDEKFYFYKSRYTNIAHLNGTSSFFKLDEDGFVVGGQICGSKDEAKQYIGRHIKEVPSILLERNPRINLKEIRNAIGNYDTQEKIKINLLNCIKIELMQRDEGMIGLRRAYLFASEFGADVRDIILSARGVDNSLFKMRHDVKILEKK